MADDDALLMPGAAGAADPNAARDMSLVERGNLQRMYIFDIAGFTDSRTEEWNYKLSAQFNPEEFEENWRVAWAKMESPGLSHRPLQYMGTENPTVAFTLIFDARAKRGGLETILKARSFLMSLCVPRRGATSVREGQAPAVLFVWPNFLSWTCVVTDLSFKYEMFDAAGSPVRYSVQVKLENLETVRFYSEDIRENF